MSEPLDMDVTGHGYYTLDENHNAVEATSLLEWARWFEDKSNRVVKQEQIGPYWISTVFLASDHAFGALNDGRPHTPILFETMVFLRPQAMRSTSRNGARRGNRPGRSMRASWPRCGKLRSVDPPPRTPLPRRLGLSLAGIRAFVRLALGLHGRGMACGAGGGVKVPENPTERTDIAVRLGNGRVVRVEATHPEHIGRVFLLDDDRAIALELRREKGPQGHERFIPSDE